MASIAGLGIGALSGLFKTGLGLSEKSDAESDLAAAKQPIYSIPKEWYDNDYIEANQAQTGLGAPSLNYYTTQSGRGLQSGLDATLQTGGNPNNIADLYDQYDQGINKIASEDSELKNSHIQNYIAANSNLANEHDKAWTLNEFEPYENRVKADNQKINAGQQNTFNGLGDLSNSVSAYATSQLFKDKLPNVNTKTIGDAKGLEGIGSGSTPGGPDNVNVSAPPNPFNTPGGMAALKQIVANNPNSPYVRKLLASLNGNNPQ